MHTYAIFTALYRPHMGGVEAYCEGLAHELVARGERVIVVTLRLSDDAEAHEMQHDGVEVFPPEDIAKNIKPAELFCPLSADSSQLAAVLYSQLGKTFVLHGPPGTGKSQTISNLIAHNLAHGRRVLFVSEKKAALDVVHNRLAKIGLKPFCLELHSNKSGKAEVLAQFAEALAVPDCRGPQDWTLNAGQLDAARGELDDYVRALHHVYPNGLSAYDCFAHAIAEGGLPEGARLTIRTLEQGREAREEARQCAVRLANDWAASNLRVSVGEPLFLETIVVSSEDTPAMVSKLYSVGTYFSFEV